MFQFVDKYSFSVKGCSFIICFSVFWFVFFLSAAKREENAQRWNILRWLVSNGKTNGKSPSEQSSTIHQQQIVKVFQVNWLKSVLENIRSFLEWKKIDFWNLQVKRKQTYSTLKRTRLQKKRKRINIMYSFEALACKKCEVYLVFSEDLLIENNDSYRILYFFSKCRVSNVYIINENFQIQNFVLRVFPGGPIWMDFDSLG